MEQLSQVTMVQPVRYTQLSIFFCLNMLYDISSRGILINKTRVATRKFLKKVGIQSAIAMIYAIDADKISNEYKLKGNDSTSMMYTRLSSSARQLGSVIQQKEKLNDIFYRLSLSRLFFRDFEKSRVAENPSQVYLYVWGVAQNLSQDFILRKKSLDWFIRQIVLPSIRVDSYSNLQDRHA